MASMAPQLPLAVIEETRKAASSDGGCIRIILRSDKINHFPPHLACVS
jgi:hypothetical protein